MTNGATSKARAKAQNSAKAAAARRVDIEQTLPLVLEEGRGRKPAAGQQKKAKARPAAGRTARRPRRGAAAHEERVGSAKWLTRWATIAAAFFGGLLVAMALLTVAVREGPAAWHNAMLAIGAIADESPPPPPSPPPPSPIYPKTGKLTSAACSGMLADRQNKFWTMWR